PPRRRRNGTRRHSPDAPTSRQPPRTSARPCSAAAGSSADLLHGAARNWPRRGRPSPAGCRARRSPHTFLHDLIVGGIERGHLAIGNADELLRDAVRHQSVLMVFAHQPPVMLLDFVIRRIRRDAEDGI